MKEGRREFLKHSLPWSWLSESGEYEWGMGKSQAKYPHCLTGFIHLFHHKERKWYGYQGMQVSHSAEDLILSSELAQDKVLLDGLFLHYPCDEFWLVNSYWPCSFWTDFSAHLEDHPFHPDSTVHSNSSHMGCYCVARTFSPLKYEHLEALAHLLSQLFPSTWIPCLLFLFP